MDVDEDLRLPQLAELIDNIKAADPDARKASLRVLHIIAEHLGAGRTREELVPYLVDSIDDEDEVMALLAEQLNNLIGPMGGPAYAHLLLPAFEQLASSEEAVVRKNATTSLNQIAEQMSRDNILDKYVPLVDRLTSAHWFNLRASACALYPTLYQVVGDEQFKFNVLQAFATLCTDNTPMVRRAAAENLEKMIELCSPKVVEDRLKVLFLRMMEDEQDSVRLLGVGLLPTLASRINSKDMIIKNFEKAIEDPAWRVRYMLADRIVGLQTSLGSSISDERLLPVFVRLLNDSEAEVRNCAASKVLEFSKNLGERTRVKSFCQKILPCVKKLAEDPWEHVRASLATVIMGLSDILGKQLTIEHLLPLFLHLLKDDHSEVRLNVISRLNEVNAVIGLEHLAQSLLPAIDDLAENDEWRTRLAIIEYIPTVSSQLGVEFFNAHLMKLCLMWLKDPVYAVRQKTVEILEKLIEAFGKAWASKVIIPEVLSMARETHFTHRLTCLFAINRMMHAVPVETTVAQLLPVVCDLHKDKIPNIRLNVAKSLSAAIDVCKAQRVSNAIRPILDILQRDSDPDVKYFAEEASLNLDSVV